MHPSFLKHKIMQIKSPAAHLMTMIIPMTKQQPIPVIRMATPHHQVLHDCGPSLRSLPYHPHYNNKYNNKYSKDHAETSTICHTKTTIEGIQTSETTYKSETSIIQSQSTSIKAIQTSKQTQIIKANPNYQSKIKSETKDEIKSKAIKPTLASTNTRHGDLQCHTCR